MRRYPRVLIIYIIKQQPPLRTLRNEETTYFSIVNSSLSALLSIQNGKKCSKDSHSISL